MRGVHAPLKLLLALLLPSAGDAQSMIKALQLMDMSASEAYELDDYLHDRTACFDGLNGELHAMHVPDKYFMLGTKGTRNQFMSMPNIAELNLVRNATLRVFRIGSTTRASIIGCIERGECGWVFAHMDTLCHRSGDGSGVLSRAVSDGRKLISGVVRAVSAFVLPDASPTSQRRVSTVDAKGWNVPPVSLLGRTPPRTMLGIDAPSSVLDGVLGYAGSVANGAVNALGMATGRQLSLWNHPVTPSLPIKTGQFDLKDFFASLAAKNSDFDVTAAESVVKRLETEALNYAMKAYAELPMDMKMVAMAAVSDQESRFKMVRYLKGTRLIESGVRHFGASDEEMRAMRGYASGDDSQFDGVAETFFRRASPPLRDPERYALAIMMRETAPVLRMNCAMLVWLHAQHVPMH